MCWCFYLHCMFVRRKVTKGCLIWQQTSAEGFITCHICAWNILLQIWHSDDCASWYILIMKANKMHYSEIYLIKYSTCFGHVHCPTSGVSQHCMHAIGICPASSVGVCRADTNRTSMTNSYCVYTVLRYTLMLDSGYVQNM